MTRFEGGLTDPPTGNIFGMDEKHYTKWARIWDQGRFFGEIKPTPERPKKLNFVSQEMLLRCMPPSSLKRFSVVATPFLMEGKVSCIAAHFKYQAVGASCGAAGPWC